MAEDICQCVKCGRMHRRLGKPPWRNRARELLIQMRAKLHPTEDRLMIVDIDELARILDERIAE